MAVQRRPFNTVRYRRFWDRERRRVGGVLPPEDVEEKVKSIVEGKIDDALSELRENGIILGDFVTKRMNKYKERLTRTIVKTMKGWANLKYVKDKSPGAGYRINWTLLDDAKKSVADKVAEEFDYIEDLVLTISEINDTRKAFIIIGDCEDDIRTSLIDIIVK